MIQRTDVPSLPRRWSEGRSRAFDAALTTVLLLPVLVFPFTSVHRSASLLSFIEIVPLLMRRVQPAGCFYTVTAATALQLALIGTPVWGQVAMPVAVFAVAAYESTVTARVALAASLVLAVAGPAVWVAGAGLPAQQVLLWFSTAILLMVASWALGSMVRARRAYAAEVLAHGERLEERAALANELATDDETDLPPHGVEDVWSLVEQARLSGMRVDAEVADPAPDVPELTGLTAYRIVQEALANVRTHAGPAASVHVSVRVIGVDLVVEILDDGLGTDGSLEELQGEGRGLAGIRDLVSRHGGHLEAGPRPGGGFAVRARLPLLSREPQA
jgi:signal transduction histidine kinase